MEYSKPYTEGFVHSTSSWERQPPVNCTGNLGPCGGLRYSEAPVVRLVDTVLIVRRAERTPSSVVMGQAEVIVGLDEEGRIINLEADFIDFYDIDKEKALRILRSAKW
ncbi:MAG: hypothetical protein ACP5I3_11680 [Thermoproteus sp.]